ncbi:unnamed protein product [Allacma fusca]|uniref:BLOC-1-related complex subunit 8 homolog n=1 Tax=Allacma fusca TaxID=39272 RepID=A0A8J2LNM3_9HEXA|nr:unnamed protein product [Allacma fusca]
MFTAHVVGQVLKEVEPILHLHYLPTSSTVTSMTGGSSHQNFGVASDIDVKVKRGVGRLSENMHIIANEPSLAMFCLQEHIRKEIPQMIKHKNDFAGQHRLLQGTLYDCDYSIGAVKSIDKSKDNFESIQNHLRNALFFKQQIKFEENRRKANEKKRK